MLSLRTSRTSSRCGKNVLVPSRYVVARAEGKVVREYNENDDTVSVSPDAKKQAQKANSDGTYYIDELQVRYVFFRVRA
jgi:hypothetical protein